MAPNDGKLSCIIIILYECGIAICFYTFLSLDGSNNSVLNSVNKFSSMNMSTFFITLIIRTYYKQL